MSNLMEYSNKYLMVLDIINQVKCVKESGKKNYWNSISINILLMFSIKTWHRQNSKKEI